MYKIRFQRKAAKQIDKLPLPDFLRVRQAIMSLSQDPRHPGVIKLKNQNAYRLRVGVYRVLFTIDDHLNEVSVYNIGHRRDVYR